MKETFIIRTEWHTAISALKPTEQATIFQNLFHYHKHEENLINLKNPQVNLVWQLIEPNLKRNIENYDRRRESSIENGKKGGRPRKTNELEKPNNLTQKPNKPKEPIETLSVSDSDPDIPFSQTWPNQISEDRHFVEQTCQAWAISEKQLGDMLSEFILIKASQRKVWKDYHDCKSNFYSWGKMNNRYMTYRNGNGASKTARDFV